MTDSTPPPSAPEPQERDFCFLCGPVPLGHDHQSEGFVGRAKEIRDNVQPPTPEPQERDDDGWARYLKSHPSLLNLSLAERDLFRKGYEAGATRWREAEKRAEKAEAQLEGLERLQVENKAIVDRVQGAFDNFGVPAMLGAIREMNAMKERAERAESRVVALTADAESLRKRAESAEAELAAVRGALAELRKAAEFMIEQDERCVAGSKAYDFGAAAARLRAAIAKAEPTRTEGE